MVAEQVGNGNVAVIGPEAGVGPAAGVALDVAYADVDRVLGLGEDAQRVSAVLGAATSAVVEGEADLENGVAGAGGIDFQVETLGLNGAEAARIL